MESKVCTKCHELKSWDAYYKFNGKPTSACRECVLSLYHRSPEGKKRKADYYRMNINKARNSALIHWFGLPLIKYERMAEAQHGRCAICKKKDPKLSVDHDHSCCPSSGRRQRTCGKCIRALLCRECNYGLGFFKENPTVLRAAIRYLSSFPKKALL